MGVERQQGRPYQRLLFPEFEEGLRHGDPGEGGTGPGAAEEQQTPAALDPARALTERLMEEVCQLDNLNQAYRRVKANQGAPGVDGMTSDELPSWFAAHQQEFLAALRDGT
jgi:RNA-directed DNA polymerase